VNNENKRKVFKLNEDDILEILSEHLAEESGFDTFQSQAILLGTPGNDLRLVAVVGDLEDDEISGIDLEEMDIELNYNGSHPD